MAKTDSALLSLLLKYSERILKYSKEVTLEDFIANEMIYDACVLNFINIGKVCKEISPELKLKYPEIPFRKIIGLRNIAAHNYEGIEAFRLYQIVTEIVPPFKNQISEILENES
ncbi:MAG: DUF86 domain-containing protein [Aequorivita sp.]|nr:DUF86 domain-containing protein [Aequorivita sp.]